MPLSLGGGLREKDLFIVDGKVDIDGLDWAFHNLGDLYSDQGKLIEARRRKIYIRALQGSQKALGPDHTSTLDTVNNLGNLYKNQGKASQGGSPGQAKEAYQRRVQRGG
jgi:hypothetical protein